MMRREKILVRNLFFSKLSHESTMVSHKICDPSRIPWCPQPHRKCTASLTGTSPPPEMRREKRSRIESISSRNSHVSRLHPCTTPMTPLAHSGAPDPPDGKEATNNRAFQFGLGGGLGRPFRPGTRDGGGCLKEVGF